jgi:hypothetical protein
MLTRFRCRKLPFRQRLKTAIAFQEEKEYSSSREFGGLNEQQSLFGEGWLKSKPTGWSAVAGAPPGRLFAFDPTRKGRLEESNGVEMMIQKKADGKQLSRSVHSLASRLLSGTVRATMQVIPQDEPWRAKKSKGKGRGKKHQ